MRSIAAAILFIASSVGSQPIDERPGVAGEWGFRPADGAASERNPPAFSWRPQEGAARYTLQIAPDDSFERVEYQASGVEFSVHCPSEALQRGTWSWRFRFEDASGRASDWSRVRHFEIGPDSTVFPFPSRDELLSRVPDAHPRLFLRPENVAGLRETLQHDEPDALAELLARCDAILADPPPTGEPPTYPAGMERGSDPWREIWWGNRRYTIAVLDGAATLGFAYVITEDETYAEGARRLLMAAAAWDPRGSTGYRYNDEAGMPYAYHFSRTYTFIHDVLTEEEREACREVMRVRGREMYAHLCPRHLWRPYSSHSNRAWHFLGEVAIAFHGEIPEADDWLWFACNVFACAYPVWSDEDGGWHEGVNYWSSYIARFTWWADVMREALGIDAYDLPYFGRAGDYAMCMVPPGSEGAGFGDLNARVTSDRLVPLMTTLAAQARNPYWRWYVDAHGGPRYPNDYPSLLRRALPAPEGRAPTDRPTSRLFGGTGQAVLNSTLLDGRENVQVVFKSSPFGSQSHGYEAQNAFLLSAYGKPLLIRSGRRDSYGSDHHRHWMWQTKSVNSVLVNGEGQSPVHSSRSRGRITQFHTSPAIDYVEGDASGAYGDRIESFRRAVLFLKPDAVVIVDDLAAPEPSSFDLLLHAPEPFEVDGTTVRFRNGDAAGVVRFSSSAGLTITTTDRFDPPPRERIRLVEHHLTARTATPSRSTRFVTVVRTHRAGEEGPSLGSLERVDGATRLAIPVDGAMARIEIADEAGPDGAVPVSVWIEDPTGRVIDRWSSGS